MYTEMLKVAVETARGAGEILMKYYHGTFKIKKKGEIDLVTDADEEAQEYILERLRKEYPNHGFLAEESGKIHEEREFIWVIDPLDGTTNFAHKYPVFCVSMALRHRGEEVLGVVFAPVFNELFTGLKGNGAFLNGCPIKVSSIGSLIESMLVTGFPYDIHHSNDDTIDLFTKFLRRAQAVRRDGSAALDICWIAMGRFDGFWERRLLPWDTAAASVVVKEAGGQVTRFDGSPFSIFDREILVSNGKIHQEMVRVLKSKK